MTKELVIISGTGGTGNTSAIASFVALATNKLLADCDVDAADYARAVAEEYAAFCRGGN